MNPRERVLAALNPQEPGRVPFDLGSVQATGMHVVAYRGLREALGLLPDEPVARWEALQAYGVYAGNGRL